MASRSLPSVLLAATLAVACAPEGDFPSLAHRPSERDVSTEPPARPPAATARDPAVVARIAELRQMARQGEAEFEAALGPASAAVASAGPARSDSWIIAQQAVSRLEAARTSTTRALGDLDQLALARAATPTHPDDEAAIDEAIAAVQAIAVGQQSRLDRLRGRLAAA